MKRALCILLLSISLAGTTAGPAATVSAASPTDTARQQACQGITGQAGGTCGTGGVDIGRVVKAVLNILSIIAGVTAVIMIIISGMKYITSNGDAQAVSGAKRTLIYAMVGLVVVALSQFLVHFVLSNV